MKKLRSNGGYSLVYVVVAMTLILAIVGGLGLTASRNLASQQQAVDRLKARYDAAGKIEKIYGISVSVNLTPASGHSAVPSPSSLNSEGEGGGGEDWNWLKDTLGKWWNSLTDDERTKLGNLLAGAIAGSVGDIVNKGLENALQMALEEIGKEVTVGEDFTVKVNLDGSNIVASIESLPLTSISEDNSGIKATIDTEMNVNFQFTINSSKITCAIDPTSITYKSYSVTYSDGTTEEGADT